MGRRIKRRVKRRKGGTKKIRRRKRGHKPPPPKRRIPKKPPKAPKKAAGNGYYQLELEDYAIPEQTVSTKSDLLDAPIYYNELVKLLAQCAQCSNTDGSIIFCALDKPYCINMVAFNNKARQIHVFDVLPTERVHYAKKQDNIAVYDGHVEEELEAFVASDPAPVSMLVLGTYVGVVLDRVADRLVPGTTIIAPRLIIDAALNWLQRHNHECYAVSRSDQAAGDRYIALVLA